MLTKHYICPYDMEVRNGRITRTPSIYRYMPSEVVGVKEWQEVEILGNNIIVKVRAEQTEHDKINADADFTAIEDIPIDTLKTILTSFGYNSSDLTGTVKDMINFSCGFKNKMAVNTAKDGLDIKEQISNPTGIETLFDRIAD